MSDVRVASTPMAGAPAGTAARVSWGAIFAGAVVAVALMILFTTFGLGIGTALIDPGYEANPVAGIGTGSAIYLVVSQLIALAVGGYVAARLAGIPRPVTSALHGAAVWSVASIFLAWAAISGGGAIFGATSTLLNNTVDMAGDIGDAVVPDDFDLPNPGELASSVSIEDLPEEFQARLRQQGITQQNIRQEATAAFRNVFSQQEQEAVMTEAGQTLTDVLRTPGDADEDIAAFFDRLVGGPNAIISQEDRAEAKATIERRLGITPEDAEQVIVQIEETTNEALAEAQDVLQAAQTQATEAAQAASDAISTAALLLSLASLLGLIAACGGAFAGKPESLVGDRLDDHV
ncbi:hypothetical protein [Jannaschia donghaensis]|uniref:Uncharacterized protein n=1 Tax=Jannaschia donghaensis TaxID=420998 RepID=A0A0M6YJ48_9RHOB|nr:hypothetical protein [Jannaschia donghaensis]CTQ49944.1 hypothetical protein JDO7802_01961 [Jannaschia donghaensis]